ncbi:hypothetical protein PBT88_09855 [Sphingomonas abietis]|uniref:DUF937 domain-containing protein n=1 Tax=Sphingomonas abietis TaxID=3012344 RepID=A0ABY7NUQ2_9SPHN|nr:hypothetical protein [Sphingomonas abietis]WBO24373.1 hypothetical protein PBT88_09855 [Sphingomonas abietis]
MAPALAPKLAEHADNGGLDGTPTASAPPPPGTEEAAEHGNSVLASIFGSKDVSRSVAGDASAQTGIGVDKVKAVLPQLASIAAIAFLTHRASAEGGGGLGGLFASVEKGFGLP